ncbi:hypothetical protein [Shewanella inventionis]|uniref:Uncharacterized protein n=1 Tax=Shewanella inventionis TaxID=1738770 RepID=A0ABQ1JWS2_9GAMM|nr:hypothetical protein [Shewanella inventionis]GGB76397.1 hypothetical protein GCM10011607_40820 [Shewanella inventionis]
MGLFAIGAAYYFGYSAKRLVSKSADEEFAMLAAAESDLSIAN